MDRPISRRDFLNGVAMTLGAAIVPSPLLAFDSTDTKNYYPPALTGLRGSHVGSFEVAHEVRDNLFWEHAGTPTETGEVYDLVVVGGGISGLAAAHFYRMKAGAKARILVLDNHDDFGGHAKRNEFRVGDQFRLGYGGTFSIESPGPYSAVSKQLVEDLGIDVTAYAKYVNKNLYRDAGLAAHIFFDRETFGADRLVVNPMNFGASETGDKPAANEERWKKFLGQAPLSATAMQDLQRLVGEQTDYLPGLTSDEKKARLARMSYAKFLTDLVKVSDEIVKLYQAMPQPLFGVGIDAMSAQDGWGLGFPGFAGMNLEKTPGKGMNRDAIPNAEAEKYFFHFPDGNASIARMLVRKLVPEAIPGASAEDVVMARADYSKLDQKDSAVRIRLNSTAVRVKHAGAKEVEVVYSKGGKLYLTKAANCILACWHVVIPYICTELPEKQKAALSEAAKVPLLYTNVALKNWNAFQKVGASSIYAPGSYHSFFTLDIPVSMGGYEAAKSPDEAVLVHMMKTPCRPGHPARDQHRIGRGELFSTPFEAIERKIRDEMARALAGGGFDPARDIAAITVNRWPHGYAYEYNSLWDPFWLEGGETPCEVARKPFGRIAIANSDAGAYAYTDSAIDQAWRAVGELEG
jgi:spermidine dehydrogenase